jgi:acyl-CoA thioesterase
MVELSDDPIRYAKEVVGQDPFAAFLGIRIEDAGESYARASIVIQDHYCNARTRSHGGVLFTLADQAFAVAVHCRGVYSFALEIKINYFQAANPGETITAEATPIDIRKRVSLWNIELTNPAGDRIATAQGLAYHLL